MSTMAPLQPVTAGFQPVQNAQMAVSSVAVLVRELRAPLKSHRLPLGLQAGSELQAAYWCVVAAVLNSVDAFRAAADDETALQVRLVAVFLKRPHSRMRR